LDFIGYFIYKINKKLRFGFVGCSGRNFSGRICVHHRSSGHKRNSFLIDFYKRLNCFGMIIKLIKSSFYSSFIGLILYANGLCHYTLVSEIKNYIAFFIRGFLQIF